MKRNPSLSLIFLILLFTNCQNAEKKVLRLKQKELSFVTHFPSYNLNYFTDDTVECISFADFVTSKKISFHSLKSGKKWSVSLVSLMNKEKEKFIYYHVVSSDSIILLSKYTNKIYLINRKAEILKKLDYSRLLLEGIEFVPPIYTNGTSIYLAFNNYPVKKPQSSEEQTNWEQESFKKGCITKINMENDLATPEYLGQNLFNRFIKKNQVLADGVHFYLNRSKVYYHSAYSDTIYLIDPTQIFPLLKVHSDIGKIALSPSTREAYKKNVNCINEAYLKNAFISSLLFDDIRNLVYVFIRKPKIGENFPFRILIYDQNFKKLDETGFDGTKYHPNGFIGKEGLYLLRKFDINPNQKSFDLFVYEK